MKNAEEALKTAGEILERYRKNKTMVSPEDLRGKYKSAFEKLKNELRDALSDYLKAYCLEGITVKQDDGAEFIEACNRSFIDSGIGKAVGIAAFKSFDLAEVQRIAEAHRKKIMELWEPYFHKHTCIYAYGQCFAEDPDNPLIYNDLVDMFWDEAAGGWIKKEKPAGDAILIFIKQ